MQKLIVHHYLYQNPKTGVGKIKFKLHGDTAYQSTANLPPEVYAAVALVFTQRFVVFETTTGEFIATNEIPRNLQDENLLAL